jgi:hypothetical protein
MKSKKQNHFNNPVVGYLVLALVVAIGVIIYFSQAKGASNVSGEIIGQSYFQKNGGFNAFFPEEPTLTTLRQDFGNGNNNVLDYVYDFTSPDGSYELIVTYAKSALANQNTTVEESLKNEVTFTGNGNGYEVISSNITSYKGLPAIDYVAYNRAANLYQVGRDVAKNNDLYMLTYLYPSGKEDKNLSEKFLNSLSFSQLAEFSNNSDSSQSTPVVKQNNDLPSIIKKWSPSVALLVCSFSSTGSIGFGSGFLTQFADGSIVVVTNKHVLTDTYGYSADSCSIQIPGDGNNYYTVPGNSFQVSSLGYDWGSFPVTNGSPYFNAVAKKGLQVCLRPVETGDNILILGYPSYAGSFTNPTATQGIISGYDNPYYTTSAKIEQGNSGGVAIQPERDCYAGIPSAVKLGAYENLGRILNANKIFQLNY